MIYVHKILVSWGLGSLQDALDADLCLDVFYALVGCGIAYVMVR